MDDNADEFAFKVLFIPLLISVILTIFIVAVILKPQDNTGVIFLGISSGIVIVEWLLMYAYAMYKAKRYPVEMPW